jgi:hypothetical protein
MAIRSRIKHGGSHRSPALQRLRQEDCLSSEVLGSLGHIAILSLIKAKNKRNMIITNMF